MDPFLDTGKLLKMDHRLQVALNLDNAHPKPLDEKVAARRNIPLENADTQAFVHFLRLKALWSEPELQQLLTEGKITLIHVSLRCFHRTILGRAPF